MLRQSFVEKGDTYDPLYQVSEQDPGEFSSALRERKSESKWLTMIMTLEQIWGFDRDSLPTSSSVFRMRF